MIKTLKHKNIRLAGSMKDCHARMVWQGLFDVYREYGGSLENLDNLLIDLGNCEDAVEEAQAGLVGTFLWGFFQRSFCTAAIPCANWSSKNVEHEAIMLGCDVYALVEVNDRWARFHVFTLEGE